MQDDFVLQMRTDPALLCSARWLVRTWLRDHGFAAERVDEAVLAVDEACANAIRHSYGGREDQTLWITLSATEAWMTLTLRDEGQPIPVEKAGRPDEARVEEERLTPGGLGLFLIYNAFDEVQYEPGVEAGNRVIMRLRRTPRTGT